MDVVIYCNYSGSVDHNLNSNNGNSYYILHQIIHTHSSIQVTHMKERFTDLMDTRTARHPVCLLVCAHDDMVQ